MRSKRVFFALSLWHKSPYADKCAQTHTHTHPLKHLWQIKRIKLRTHTCSRVKPSHWTSKSCCSTTHTMMYTPALLLNPAWPQSYSVTGESLCKDPIQIAWWQHRNENIRIQIKSVGQVHLVWGAGGGGHMWCSPTKQYLLHITPRPANIIEKRLQPRWKWDGEE